MKYEHRIVIETKKKKKKSKKEKLEELAVWLLALALFAPLLI